jgi:uncharacterized protein YkwD
MRFLPVALLLLAAGCRREFTTPDEACTDRIRGDGPDSNGSHEAVRRANCYRRLVGLDEVGTDDALQQVVDDHLDYMIVNETTDDAEDPSNSGFTGEDLFVRLENAGIPMTNVLPWALSAAGEPDTASLTATEVIDAMVWDPWARQVVLQPGARALGFGVKQGWWHVVELAPWPTGEAVRFPAVYPANGQIDVPIEVFALPPLTDVDFGLPESTALGFPMTITVGSFSTAFDSENPYGLVATDVSLTGPDGEHTVYVVQPGESDLSLFFTVIVAPEGALQADSEYTLRAHLEWVDGVADVESTFTTASE